MNERSIVDNLQMHFVNELCNKVEWIIKITEIIFYI